MPAARTTKLITVFVSGLIILLTLIVTLYVRVTQGVVQQTISQPATSTPPVIQETPASFIPQFPYQQLMRHDILERPAFNDLRSATYLNGYVYVAAFDSIIKIDPTTNAIVAYSNPTVIPFPKFITTLGNKLFIATFKNGIYELDGTTERVENHYDLTNGLRNIQNLELTSDGASVWVGTFNGVARITNGHVYFYDESLAPSGECTVRDSLMYTFNGVTWALLGGSGSCRGGVARYNAALDTWHYFSPNEIDPALTGNIYAFVMAPVPDTRGDVYLLSNENRHDIIRRYNAAKNSWSIVKVFPPSFGESQKFLAALSKQDEWAPFIFTDTIATSTHAYQSTKIQVKKSDGGLVAATFQKKSFAFVTSTPDSRGVYLMSHEGLELLGPVDMVHPVVLVPTPPGNNFDFSIDGGMGTFFSPDYGVMLIYQSTPSDYGGVVSYNFLVLNTKTNTGFATSLAATAKDDTLHTTREEKFYQKDGVFYFTNTMGITFTIDVAGKKIVRTAL